jgi:hypothetical protein
VLEQDLSGLHDSLLIKSPGGHVLQQGNVRDNLLGVGTLARDRHPATSLSAEQNYASFVQG